MSDLRAGPSAQLLAASLVAASLCAACDDGAPPPPPPIAGGEATLDHGIRVVVADETGAVALFDGDRELVRTAPGAYPTVRTFSERVTNTLGIWTFRRTGETVHAYSYFSALETSADAVTVHYRLLADPSADDPIEGEATLRIEAGPRADTTRITLSATGPEQTSLAIPIACMEEGSFHGFGEQYNATDQRGEAFDLFVSEQGIGRDGTGLREISGDAHTTYFPMPYYLDARGFGVLARTFYRTHVDVCASDADVAWLEVISGEPLDLLVMHGPTPKDVVRELGEEVGIPAPPPDWAWRAWISSQGGRDPVLADVAALDTESIEASAIWSQDWTGLRMNIGGGFGVEYRWEDDETLYPDLTSMITDLHARDLRFLAYANPFVDPDLPNHYAAMADANLLVMDASGEPYVFPAPNGMSAHPDLTNEAARDYVRNALRSMIADHGIDGWMADFGEWTPLDAVLSSGEDPRAFHNRFPIEWHRVTREAFDMERPDGDWVSIARSGWTGVQRYSMIHWVGDQEVSFSPTDGLPTVVPALVNLGLAAVPYTTLDIGGFSGGPSDRELYERWVELGAFAPIMRTHEGNMRDRNHNWDSDPETTAHFRRFAAIHAALAPDLMRWSAEAQATSVPLVRHLLLEFPDDRASWGVHDEMMLGDAFLIAPVVTQGATERQVYLPAGATWFHVFTGESYDGGQTVTVSAPIGTPPVFHRDSDRADLRAL